MTKVDYKNIDDNYKKKNATVFLKNVSMIFGLNKALDGVDLAIMPGEIHGLLGQNGCGKSTLIKVLSGFNHPDKGSELYINGSSVKLPLDPDMLTKYGLSFVHQDLGLVPSLSVLENLRNVQIFSSGAKIHWKKERAAAEEILNRYNIHVNLDSNIESLNQVDKAMISIVRAVESIKGRSDGRGLLVLDEPTVFLTKTEVDTLFKLVREIASEGLGVLFVSHDLDEVMEITDIITVLRDGVNSGEAITAETTKDGVIEMILGQKLSSYVKENTDYHYHVHPDAVKFSHIKGETIRDVSFSVNPGEIVGVTGLVGSGFGEIPYVLFGANEFKGGTMEIHKKQVDLANYDMKKAVSDNIALIPADRPHKGGIMDLLIEENVMMQVHKKYHPWHLQSREMRKKAEDLNEQYAVYPNDVKLNFGNLSGGNQQKVILGRWLLTDPEVLLLDEPTRGIDVGAKYEIYQLIIDLANRGKVVIVVSSEMPELLGICDRIMVMSGGRLAGEINAEEATQELIMTYAAKYV